MSDEDRLALFDLDGTLADYDAQLITDLEALASPDEPPIDLVRLADGAKDSVPMWLQRRIWVVRDQPGWWRKLPKLRAGFQILKMAQDVGFTIQVLTKRPHSSPASAEKIDWCTQHLPGIGVNIVEGKGGTYGRVLCDDWVPYMTAWLKHRPNGLGLMPITKYNVDWTHPQVIKYDTTKEYAKQENIDTFKRIGHYEMGHFAANTEIVEALKAAYER